MMSSFTDRSAYFEVATVLSDPKGNTLEHVFKVPAVIETTVKVANVGIDGIIRLQHEDKVLAEGKEEDRFDIFAQGYRKVCEELVNKKNESITGRNVKDNRLDPLLKVPDI